MRDATDPLLTAIIKKLETDNTISYNSNDIPVYVQVPNDNELTEHPIIIIEPTSSTETNVTKDTIGQAYTVNIEVISRFNSGGGGWGANNSITSQIKMLMRNISDYLDLSADNFKVIRQLLLNSDMIRDAYDEGVYFRTISVFEFHVEDIS